MLGLCGTLGRMRHCEEHLPGPMGEGSKYLKTRLPFSTTHVTEERTSTQHPALTILLAFISHCENQPSILAHIPPISTSTLNQEFFENRAALMGKEPGAWSLESGAWWTLFPAMSSVSLAYVPHGDWGEATSQDPLVAKENSIYSRRVLNESLVCTDTND